MKTENEIKALPLQEKQKLIIELRQVKTGDKAYPNAKAIIELITSEKKWKEPETVEVKNIAGHAISIDDAVVAADATAKVFPWQLSALARFLEPVAKAAALIALMFGLLLGSAQAYDTPSIAGLNGGTNVIAASTTNSYNAATYVTNTIVSPNWIVSNGVASVTFTTNTVSITTNVPGVFALGNYDKASIEMSFALAGSGTANAVASFSTSADGNTYVQGFLLPVTGAGTTVVGAITNLTQFAPGYIRLDSIVNSNSVVVTNLSVVVGRKQSVTGP